MGPASTTPEISATSHKILMGLTVPAALQVISEDVGLSLDKVEPTMLGTAKKVTISKDDTIILDGGGAKEAIQERSDQIREAIDNSSSDYDRCALHVEGY